MAVTHTLRRWLRRWLLVVVVLVVCQGMLLAWAFFVGRAHGDTEVSRAKKIVEDNAAALDSCIVALSKETVAHADAAADVARCAKTLAEPCCTRVRVEVVP